MTILCLCKFCFFKFAMCFAATILLVYKSASFSSYKFMASKYAMLSSSLANTISAYSSAKSIFLSSYFSKKTAERLKPNNLLLSQAYLHKIYNASLLLLIKNAVVYK